MKSAFAGLFLLVTAALWSGCAAHTYPGPVHGLTFDGTVQSINLTNQTLGLLPLKPGQPAVFTWDATTKFWRNGVPIRPQEIERGNSVRIHYHVIAGERIAHHVYIEVPYAPQH